MVKPQDNYDIIKNKLTEVLHYIDNSHVRNEYKLRVLSDYAMRPLRYLLTVHSLTDTQLESLDSIQTKLVKKMA